MVFIKILGIIFMLICHAYTRTPPPKVTGPKKPNFDCSSYFNCDSRTYGNYRLETDPNDSRIGKQTLANGDEVFDYFVSCSPSGTWCMACAPKNTWYDKPCDKCLFLSTFSESYPGRCPVTPTWKTIPTPICPQMENERADKLCENKGAEYCGNVAHFKRPNPSGGPAVPNANRQPTRTFIMCWMGKYRGCQNCGEGLLFREGINWQGESDIYGHCS